MPTQPGSHLADASTVSELQDDCRFSPTQCAGLAPGSCSIHCLCRALNLLGGKRVAADGSYFNGNVSDASFHSLKRLAEDIEKLGSRIDEWLNALDQADRDDLESPSRDPDLPAKLELQALKESKERTH